MGRTSWEIFGDDLTSANNIVLTRNPRKVQNAITVPSFDKALERAEATGATRVFVAGGASVYEQALPVADALYLSYVKGDFDGDTFFPDLRHRRMGGGMDAGTPRLRFRRLRSPRGRLIPSAISGRPPAGPTSPVATLKQTGPAT